MGERASFQCPNCREQIYISGKVLVNLLREIKVERASNAMQDLQRKSGPYYDRWKAAMDARGEQKRCKDCAGYDAPGFRPLWYSETCEERGHKLGEFACSYFSPKVEE